MGSEIEVSSFYPPSVRFAGDMVCRRNIFSDSSANRQYSAWLQEIWRVCPSAGSSFHPSGGRYAMRAPRRYFFQPHAMSISDFFVPDITPELICFSIRPYFNLQAGSTRRKIGIHFRRSFFLTQKSQCFLKYQDFFLYL